MALDETKTALDFAQGQLTAAVVDAKISNRDESTLV